jgi:hypothetical protein
MMLNNFGRSGEQLVSCSVQLAKYSRRQQPDAQMASGKESRMLTAHSRERVVYDNLQPRRPVTSTDRTRQKVWWRNMIFQVDMLLSW